MKYENFPFLGVESVQHMMIWCEDSHKFDRKYNVWFGDYLLYFEIVMGNYVYIFRFFENVWLGNCLHSKVLICNFVFMYVYTYYKFK